MKARRLSVGKTVLWEGEVVRIHAVNRGVNVRISGEVWLRPGRKEVTYCLAPATAVPLCTSDGVRTEGKTKAEIEAETVVASLARYGITAEMRVEHRHGAVWATVTLPREHGILSDLYTGMWYTRTEGRKTTGFTGFVLRGLYRGRKHHKANITRRQFHSEVGSRISMVQHRMHKVQQEAKAG